MRQNRNATNLFSAGILVLLLALGGFLVMSCVLVVEGNAQAEVEILTHSSYITPDGWYRVVGEVKNLGSRFLGPILLNFTFYDANNSIILTKNGTTSLSVLSPNRTSPFSCYVIAQVEVISSYSVSVISYYTATAKPYNLNIAAHSYDNTSIYGIIENRGYVNTTYTIVFATFYDENKTVVDLSNTDPGSIDDIGRGNSTIFEISHYLLPHIFERARWYSLTAECEQYALMEETGLTKFLPAKASGTIYIRADGSVYPPTAPIQRTGNIYTLNGNITSDGDGIIVEKNDVTVDGAGYTVTGSGSGNGIDLSVRSNVTVRNMPIKNFGNGIYLSSSSGNTLSGNNVTANNSTGIMLYAYCSNNVLSGNHVANNVGAFYVERSTNNTFSGNVMRGNQFSFGIVGSALGDYLHSIDTSNLVDGKPVYYFVNQSNIVVNAGAYPQVGYLGFVNCANVTVQGLNLTSNINGLLLAYTNNSRISDNNIAGNVEGIGLHYSFDNTLFGNNVTNNYFGIGLGHSSDNSFSGNNITENNVGGPGIGIDLIDSSGNTFSGNNIANHWTGIELYDSSCNTFSGNKVANNRHYGVRLFGSSNENNVFYHNSFINSTFQHADNGTPDYANSWDDGYPSGGNYWSGNVAIDENSGPSQDQPGSDGIADTPYTIDENNTDHYPLAVPWGPISEYPSGIWNESPNYSPMGWRNVTYVIIHVMDGYINSAINTFKNPASNVSAHYLISQEGEIVQMVREKDIAWHAGNWTYNQQSIGIEHEDKGNWNTPNWVPEELYQTSAALVRYICEKYGIPRNRAHIIGHTEVPSVVKPCPGPYWDWEYFMGLVNETLAQRTFVARWDGTDYPLSVLSNSTASDFIFSQQPPHISINFTAPTGTHSFCNLTIPKDLLKGDWTIYINGNSSIPFTKTENATHTFLSFNFTHLSTVNVIVGGTWAIPEFPSFLILLLFMVAALLAAIAYRRKRFDQPNIGDLC